MPSVVMCGIPRSGSTLVWQIVAEALPGTTVVHTHPAVWKAKPSSVVIGSVRNPYDVAASLYRVRLSRSGDDAGGVEGLKAELGWARKNFAGASVMFLQKSPQHARTILRYEDFLHDYDVIYSGIQ